MFKNPSDTNAANVLKLWNITSSVSFVRGIENFVYVTEDKTKFLRLTDPEHRKISEIQSELNWIIDLHSNGINLANPYKSKNGDFVEPISIDGQEFSAVLFAAALGRFAEKREDFTPQLLKNWGKCVGKLHHLSKSYKPTSQTRLKWNQEPGFLLAENALDKKDSCFKVYRELKKYLLTLPTDNHNFGLIHADFHTGNFFITENFKITVFDFDDSQYHWFIYDLAVIMSSLQGLYTKNKWTFNYNNLWTLFLKGYLEENNITEEWIKRVPIFIYWRHALLYFWATERIKNNGFLKKDLLTVNDFRKNLVLTLKNFDAKILN